MFKPSAFTVFRLMIISNFVGVCTGRSAGLSPPECDQRNRPRGQFIPIVKHFFHISRRLGPPITWEGLRNPNRPTRHVVYVDLSRIQPVSGRIGYAKIAKSRHKEASATAFDEAKVKRLSGIMGRHYDGAKMALTDIDAKVLCLSSASRRNHIPALIGCGRDNYSGISPR